MPDEIAKIEPELTKEEFESLVPGLLKLNQWLKPKIKEIVKTNIANLKLIDCIYNGLRFFQVTIDGKPEPRLILSFTTEAADYDTGGIYRSYFDVEVQPPDNPPLIKEG